MRFQLFEIGSKRGQQPPTVGYRRGARRNISASTRRALVTHHSCAAAPPNSPWPNQTAREDCRSEAMPEPLQIVLCWNPSARHERATMARAILPRDRINAPRSSPTIRADTSEAPTLRRVPRGRLHEPSEADSADYYASARSRVDFHISAGMQGRNAGSKRPKLTAPPARRLVLFFKKNLDAVATEKHSGLGTLESPLRAKPKSAQTEPTQNET